MDLKIKQKRVFLFPAWILYLFFFSIAVTFTACSFDYGDTEGPDKSRPDIVMENLDYVRVRGGDPLVRFQAEHAERWEDRQTMELRNFSFEQMENHGETVNAGGRAGLAVVQLGSGDISLKGGVRIRVDSEDITIRTAELEWKDKEKTLTGGTEDEVDIDRSDGTRFLGRGFFSDARNRTWDFSGEVKGTYVEKKNEEKTEGEGTKETVVSAEDQSSGEVKEETEQFLPSQEQSLGTPPPPPPLQNLPILPEDK